MTRNDNQRLCAMFELACLNKSKNDNSMEGNGRKIKLEEEMHFVSSEAS